MTLLNEVMHRPLDPGYAEAAERRRRGGERPLSAGRRVLMLVVAATLGLVVTTAAAALRAPQPEALQARALLTEQIAEQSALADELVTTTDTLTREIGDLRTAALAAQDPELLALLVRDELAAGTGAVGGPGLRVTVEDAPVTQADPEAADPDLRVQDVDLQVVVNGLWAAGAEAVAINGQRLTALTAVRTAGSAILVDLAPLSSPYAVEAVGDPTAMQTAFARTSAGQHLATLRNTYGIPSRVTAADDLRLPGSSRTRLQSATAATAATSPTSDAGPGDAAVPPAPRSATPAPSRSRDRLSPTDVAGSGAADESGEGTS
jgi:uncharacterized protein YlxW (UPF0749 family)